eukprot:3059394-Amphidinium_carterae.1
MACKDVRLYFYLAAIRSLGVDQSQSNSLEQQELLTIKAFQSSFRSPKMLSTHQCHLARKHPKTGPCTKVFIPILRRFLGGQTFWELKGNCIQRDHGPQ